MSGVVPRRELAAVAIGRNEAPRLRRCLESLLAETSQVVYVDSSSTDASVSIAGELGVDVVHLDDSVPLSAARARNEGFRAVQSRWPDARYIQFLDGDMELRPGWMGRAASVLAADDEVAAVWGRRVERDPSASIYNTILDVEWRLVTTNFGGDVMLRSEDLVRVGGYNPEVVAAEDDELGLRLQHQGGRLVRLDIPSSIHDGGASGFGQWWRRARRCGRAYAQVRAQARGIDSTKFRRDLARTWVYGAAVPIVTFTLLSRTHGLSLFLLAVYPLNALRVARATRSRGCSAYESLAWGVSCGVAPIPQAVGALRFHWDQRGWFGR